MDALGGYGSSDSSDNDTGDGKPKSALSGLLANLSDASDDDDDAVIHAAAAHVVALTSSDNGNEANEPAKKKMRRGGEEVANDGSVSQHVLPPPPVMSASNNNITAQKDHIGTDFVPFQSLVLSTKDYTSELRQTLTQQLQSQTSEMSQKQKQLAEKLKLLHETFQNKSDGGTQHTERSSNTTPNDTTSISSFASHLKSKQEFGNPHLLKDIIDHFQITPLVSRQFKPFEFFDRLQVSEEKARIAAANYHAGS